jgi:hypothetical protein
MISPARLAAPKHLNPLRGVCKREGGRQTQKSRPACRAAGGEVSAWYRDQQKRQVCKSENENMKNRKMSQNGSAQGQGTTSRASSVPSRCH